MDNIIRIPLLSLTRLTRRLNVCSNVGLMAGVIVGLLLAVIVWAFPALATMPASIALEHALALGLFAWLFVLFVLVVQARYTFGSVVLPSFANCLLTSTLTVFLSKWMHDYSFAWLVGMLVGVLVGMLLCRLNLRIKKGGQRHGADPV
jgi:hypothetical protein